MKNNINGHKIIVVGEEHYTPLGVIRSLGEEGIAPIAYILRRIVELKLHHVVGIFLNFTWLMIIILRLMKS